MGWEEAHSASAAYSSSLSSSILLWWTPRDLKHALGQGAGLVKDDGSGLRQRLQVIGALDQNACLAGAADAGEEAQRNADHQRARAADDQEGQGPVNPCSPLGVTVPSNSHADKRRQDRQGQGAVADRRGIDAGELGR